MFGKNLLKTFSSFFLNSRFFSSPSSSPSTLLLPSYSSSVAPPQSTTSFHRLRIRRCRPRQSRLEPPELPPKTPRRRRQTLQNLVRPSRRRPRRSRSEPPLSLPSQSSASLGFGNQIHDTRHRQSRRLSRAIAFLQLGEKLYLMQVVGCLGSWELFGCWYCLEFDCLDAEIVWNLIVLMQVVV